MTIDQVGVGLRIAIEDAAPALNSAEVRLPESELEAVLLNTLKQRGVANDEPRSQASISLKGWSGRLGPLDLALIDGEGSVSAAIELKSLGSDELSACAWDVVKLAQGIAEGAFQRGFMLAAAPLAAWEERVSGTELFEERAFELNGHLRRYEKWFDFWRSDVQNYPRVLQSRWHAIPLGSSAFSRADEVWEMRIAEIDPAGATQKRVIYAPKPIGEEGDTLDPEAEERLQRRREA